MNSPTNGRITIWAINAVLGAPTKYAARKAPTIINVASILAFSGIAPWAFQSRMGGPRCLC